MPNNGMTSFLISIGRTLSAIVIALMIVDVSLRTTFQRWGIVTETMDIQTPATLFAKLDYLRHFDGRRIVVLGDSVVYGHRMREAGDREWQHHTIPAALAARLEEHSPRRKTLVLNLGMNGATPADLDQLARMLIPLHVDCLVFDVNLRAFSGDFAAESARFSRPWLAGMTIDREFNLRPPAGISSFFESLEANLQSFAISHWYLYRVRDFVQWWLFDGNPSTPVRHFRDWLDQTLRQSTTSTQDDAVGDVLLMLQAKHRYDSITLTATNPQIDALNRMLRLLATSKQPSLFFYATEDSQRLPQLIDLQRYRRLIHDLGEIFAPFAMQGITYVPPLKGLLPQDYLDYGHLTEHGNAAVADSLLDGGLYQMLQ
jgi:lysophospholipase L1-like esterase